MRTLVLIDSNKTFVKEARLVHHPETGFFSGGREGVIG